ncbi:glycoside hydrolase family 78 protein, partial [Aureobasidium melanogenum]
VGWGDACVLVPWTLYQYYGDKAVLKRQYGSMKKKMEQMVRDARNGRGSYGKYYKGERNEHEPYILDSDKMWGEWLEPGSGMWGLFKSLMIPSPNTATAYFAHNASILAKAAETLGYSQDAEHYKKLSERVREAWRAAFVYSDYRIGDDKQDDYVRALGMNLIPESSRPSTISRLVEIIEDSDYHFETTLLNTAMLLTVLSDNGRADVAYKLLLNNQPRTFLNQVEAGATTTWETWTGYDETGKAKGSRNHVATGACTRWLQEGIVGITPLEPGYRKIKVRPLVGGGLEHAAGGIETPFGLCKASWRVLAATGMIQLGVTIPAGASGEIHLGNGEVHDVPTGTHFFEWQGSNIIATPGSPAPSFVSVETVVPNKISATSPPQSPGGTLMTPSPFNPGTPKMATSGGRLLPPSSVPQGTSKLRIDSVNSMASVPKPQGKSFALPQNGAVISWPPRAST